MRTVCKNCGGDHPKWECKRPATKSTGSTVMSGGSPDNSGSTPDNGNAGSIPAPVDTNPGSVEEGTSLPSEDALCTPSAGMGVDKNRQPIQKPKRGRPVTKNFNKAEYNKIYMRKKRARLKLEREDK